MKAWVTVDEHILKSVMCSPEPICASLECSSRHVQFTRTDSSERLCLLFMRWVYDYVLETCGNGKLLSRLLNAPSPTLCLFHGGSAASISQAGTSPRNALRRICAPTSAPPSHPQGYLSFLLCSVLRRLTCRDCDLLPAFGFLGHLANGYNQQDMEGQEKSETGVFIPATL